MTSTDISKSEVEKATRDTEEAPGYFTKKVGLIFPGKFFGVNREALEDNHFIQEDYIEMSEDESTKMAQKCFKNYVDELMDNGVSVEVFQQSTKAADSVFPDWFTTLRNPTFPNGVLIISAMKTHERRKERMEETIAELSTRYADIIDLSVFEPEEKFLELKGALVTDWENGMCSFLFQKSVESIRLTLSIGKIYCSISQRAHEEVFDYMIE